MRRTADTSAGSCSRSLEVESGDTGIADLRDMGHPVLHGPEQAPAGAAPGSGLKERRLLVLTSATLVLTSATLVLSSIMLAAHSGREGPICGERTVKGTPCANPKGSCRINHKKVRRRHRRRLRKRRKRTRHSRWRISPRAAGKTTNTSAKSATLRRGDQAQLLASLETARSMGSVSPSDLDASGGGLSDAPPDGFDPALDLPLGVERVGVRPRGLVIRETDPPNDVLPKGIVAQTAISEVTKVAADMGFPIFSTGNWISTPRRGRGPAHFDNRRTNPPRETPPFIRVDLTGGDSRQQIASSLVRAVMKAARAPRRPERILPRFVDSERESMWPEIRDKGRQTKNLRRRLQAAASNASSEHIGRWFYEMAHPVHLEAYDSGVPVSISGIATAESGFQVDWYIGIDALERPSINLTASAYKLDETIRHVINLILFAHAVDTDSEQG